MDSIWYGVVHGVVYDIVCTSWYTVWDIIRYDIKYGIRYGIWYGILCPKIHAYRSLLRTFCYNGKQFVCRTIKLVFLM